jgi:copper chaperone
MENLNLNVPAMHCNHCVHTIKMELADLDGINQVDVNLDEKNVTVQFEAPATEMMIRDLFTEINYPAEK